jgi:hypothetical protein
MATDTSAESAYEGFSAPSSIPQLTPSVELVSVAYSQPFVDVRFSPLRCCILLFTRFGFVLHSWTVFLLHQKAATSACSLKDRVIGHRLSAWEWRR